MNVLPLASNTNSHSSSCRHESWLGTTSFEFSLVAQEMPSTGFKTSSVSISLRSPDWVVTRSLVLTVAALSSLAWS